MFLLSGVQTIYDLSSGSGFIAMGYEAATLVKKIALPIASSIIGILLLLEVIKVVFGEGQVSWLKIFKLVIFLSAFSQYEELVKGLSDIVQSIVDGLSGYEHSQNVDMGKGVTAKISSNVQTEIDNEFFMVTVAKKAMSILQLISETLLIIMGPFAIMFSFIPGQESVFSGWLRNLIHVLCWSITFMVLDMITTSITVYQIAEAGKTLIKTGYRPDLPWYDRFVSLASAGLDWDLIQILVEAWIVKLIISFGYFSTPWLTSKYFGATHSAGFTKQMLATAGGVFAGVKLATGAAVSTVAPAAGAKMAKSGGEGVAKAAGMGGGSGSSSGDVVSGFASKSSGSQNKPSPGFNSVNKSEN